MPLHRNSQKRIYLEGAIYFVTTKTKGNFPYFRNPLLVELLLEEMRMAKRLKNFRLFAYVILPDHFHALIQPNSQYSISRVMFTIKKQFSHEANRLLGWNAKQPAPETVGGQTFARLRWIVDHRSSFGKRFVWQSSFHDHIIRDERDLENHFNYIHNNAVKHGYTKRSEDWQWSSYREWTNGNTDLLDRLSG